MEKETPQNKENKMNDEIVGLYATGKMPRETLKNIIILKNLLAVADTQAIDTTKLDGFLDQLYPTATPVEAPSTDDTQENN